MHVAQTRATLPARWGPHHGPRPAHQKLNMPAAPLRQATPRGRGRRQRAPAAAAETGQHTEPAPEQQQGVEEQPEADQGQAQQQQRAARLWSEIQLLAVRAQNLEASGRREEAAGVLSAALARLEGQGHEAFALVPLRQLLWHTLHTTGRHEAALEQAEAVHAAVAARYGGDAAELQLVAVRLGMSRAAAGDIEGGIRTIYTATPVLQHNLELLLGQADRMAAQAQAAAEQRRGVGGGDEEEDGESGGQPSQAEVAAVALQEMIDKVAATLGEGNFYGSLLTIEHAVESGLQRGVVEGWEELEAIVLSGFGSIMAATQGLEGAQGLVDNALQGHDRLTRELAGDALLARLMAAQNARLHEVAAQGLDHPLFH